MPLAFNLILTVVSRLLHPYSTDDKTSRLMVKRFSTVRDTQRVSQSYMEKRRGRREIEVARRRRGGIKKKNDNSKIYLGISLELLRAAWGQFSFR